jgi:hypothetical protein
LEIFGYGNAGLVFTVFPSLQCAATSNPQFWLVLCWMRAYLDSCSPSIRLHAASLQEPCQVRSTNREDPPYAKARCNTTGGARTGIASAGDHVNRHGRLQIVTKQLMILHASTMTTPWQHKLRLLHSKPPQTSMQILLQPTTSGDAS